ncbi:hypothetical protein ACF0H5_004813 [Mactra antiquata]
MSKVSLFSWEIILYEAINKSSRDKYFTDFIEDTCLSTVNNLDTCLSANNTFVSYDNNVESCIDYILVPTEKTPCVSLAEIIDDNSLNVSRHRPIKCNFTLHGNVTRTDNTTAPWTINWSKVSDDEIRLYQSCLDNDIDLKNMTNV